MSREIQQSNKAPRHHNDNFESDKRFIETVAELRELSVDAYLEKFDLVRNNAITACSSGESLQGKVGKVLNHMTQLGTMSNDLSKGIRSEINDKNSVLSIESLNAYVHNEFFYPKADNLITGWDNIESFFIQLWESIKNKE